MDNQKPEFSGEGDNDKVVFGQNCDEMKKKAMAGDEATPRARKGKVKASLQVSTVSHRLKFHALYNGPRGLDRLL